MVAFLNKQPILLIFIFEVPIYISTDWPIQGVEFPVVARHRTVKSMSAQWTRQNEQIITRQSVHAAASVVYVRENASCGRVSGGSFAARDRVKCLSS